MELHILIVIVLPLSSVWRVSQRLILARLVHVLIFFAADVLCNRPLEECMRKADPVEF